jgi:hypothetical protein
MKSPEGFVIGCDRARRENGFKKSAKRNFSRGDECRAQQEERGLIML